MEHQNSSNDQRHSETTEDIPSRQATLGSKLRDRLTSEKRNLSYADFHQPKASGNVQNQQQVKRKSSKDDEVVKYMSKLPSYLQREETLEKKALNVGVLDWGRLEKWQSNHKQIPYSVNRYSLSSSNTSSFYSTDESSTHSSRGHSCSPARQREHRSTLQSHLKVASVKEDTNEASSSKGSMMARDDEFTKREKLQEHSSGTFDQDPSGRHETVVLILPGEHARDHHSRVSQLSDSVIIEGQRSTGARRRSCSTRFDSKEREVESRKNSEMSGPSSTESQSKLSSDSAHPLPCSQVTASPSRGNKLEERLAIHGISSKVITSSEKTEQKAGRVSAADVRNPPPNHTNDAPNSASRSRSSPLRRLLDPILRPRRVSSSKERSCESLKVKLDLTGCRTTNVEDSCQEKRRSSPTQALVKVAVKNGLPLFTFAVENSSEILAASMRRSSRSAKAESSWAYTFFTIREFKKKSKSWINQGSGPGYVPNIIGQMNVCDFPFLNLSRHNSSGQFSMREFVLFSVEQRQEGRQEPEFQPADELVAIVLKVSKETSEPLSRSSHENNTCDSLSQPGHSSSRESALKGPGVGSNGILSATAILPNGVHGLPCKGEPSPLIERWKSGGICDCGGWDMGCKLRVLANRNHLGKKSGLLETCTTLEKFDLFTQDEIHEKLPIFSLGSFKDGIYSVDFDPSLSLLQAFAICIAVLNNGKLFEPLELSNTFEEKPSEVITLLENNGKVAANQIQGGIPVRFVSYPPHSPVGRV